jgi:hypothetical protein
VLLVKALFSADPHEPGALIFFERTDCGWRPDPWSGYKDCTLPRAPPRKRSKILSWLRRRHETAERIDAEADALIGELGVEAYAEARRREYESSGDAIALWWNRVALAVAHKTGERIGLDTSTRMAMNAVFAPDREHAEDRKPQPFRRVDELKGTPALKPFRLQFISSAPDRGPSIVTEVEIQASDASAAIVVAAKIAMPPRTIGLSILDSEGTRSLADEGAIAQGTTRDPDTVRDVSRRRWRPAD